MVTLMVLELVLFAAASFARTAILYAVLGARLVIVYVVAVVVLPFNTPFTNTS